MDALSLQQHKAMDKIIESYERAAEESDTKAMLNLGNCYMTGDGVTKDAKKAVKLFERASNMGDADAMFTFAVYCENGNGVEKNVRKARMLYMHAAEGGNDKAKTRFAWFLLSGCGGTEVDEDRALVLLEEREKDKDSEAMWMLGLCYEYGIGCERDVERAECLYKRCCECENVVGKFFENNGGMNKRGSGLMRARRLLECFHIS